MTTGEGGARIGEGACVRMRRGCCCVGIWYGAGQGCVGGAEVCGGAADGVGVYDSPWRVGHPVAGGTGCKWFRAGGSLLGLIK